MKTSEVVNTTLSNICTAIYQRADADNSQSLSALADSILDYLNGFGDEIVSVKAIEMRD